MGLVFREGLVQAGHDLVGGLDGEEGQAVHVADFEAHAGVQGLQDTSGQGGVHQADRRGPVLGEDRGALVAEDAAEAVQAGAEGGADHREGHAGAEVVGFVLKTYAAADQIEHLKVQTIPPPQDQFAKGFHPGDSTCSLDGGDPGLVEHVDLFPGI